MTRAMRDSGVEFLGEVPSHWDVQPAVTLARVLTSTVDKKTYEGERVVKLCNYTDVYYSDQIVDSSGFMAATATSEQIAKFSVRAGDVPFTKDSETADDIGIPSYVPKDLPGTVYGYHLSIYRPIDKRRGRFLKYLLESDYAKAYFEAKTPGVTRVGLGQATIRYFRAPTPPVEEAVAIADYLDRETARIDAFIAKNEELIALLTERRSASIVKAVTKGLDDTAELKESGVSVLGAIPVGWTVSRIRNVGRVIIGLTYSPEDICDEGDGGTLVIRAGNVQDGRLNLADRVYVSKPIPKPLRLRHGDIVICARNGSARLIGKNALATDEVLGQTWGAFMAVLRTPMNEYLRWVLNSAIFTSSLGAFATTTINQLTSSTLYSLQFAMPPEDQQTSIAAYLAEVTAAIDHAIRAARRAIELARERRAALISAAVTGKIDVGVGA
ncbi:restriction endonuclease subunit S [Microbacterium sp. Sa4CUA7]|uniref:Restriction endonuclease subunit S n=1 Tax=Microbacterium pullorum TaxID=2762236 RepID=A0ABR8RYV5_9MICO|nr:restriction endonuclease subunit S [Microbacterium pullorum]MBD7956391.1 restriction endonuclease subunit S [Microbacterium pullorum]